MLLIFILDLLNFPCSFIVLNGDGKLEES